MAAVEYDPYFGDGASVVPHLPSTENLGGTSKQNDPARPPDPVLMPDARDHNAMSWALAAQGRTTPAMVLSIAFAAGAPYVAGITNVNSGIDSGDISLTDNAAGDTTIEWPADSFPVVNGISPHSLTVNEDVAIDEMRAIPVSNGVRVKTKAATVGTDAAFTIVVQGQ